MKIVAALFLLAAVGAQTQAAPALGLTTVSPVTAVIGTPTQVTVQASITDQTLIANGANLVQLNADGTTTILGTLHDDGLNGDETAGDLVFTLVVTLNSTSAAQVQLQVVAAFKGILLRVKSPVVSVFFQSANAPQQSLSALAQFLSTGDVTSALNYVVPSNKTSSALSALSPKGLKALASMLQAAVLSGSQNDLRIFQAPVSTASGSTMVEFTMVPGLNGVWVINSW